MEISTEELTEAFREMWPKEFTITLQAVQIRKLKEAVREVEQ